MVLLRRVIGDALRARRQSQQRTLREVSTAANVSLGYLSEIERGQKEASSELLSSICDALGAQLSEVLREVSDTLALAEQMADVLVPVGGPAADGAATVAKPDTTPAPAARVARATARPAKAKITDGEVSVAVRHDGPLKTTLRATRAGRQQSDRDVVRAA
ncbi:helix-turn-helix domain-containing protein [Planosporangium sp. 12N6]|uniref:helix-turn-helix domain-containing protein n=1 Tax=Planosporangium spinosum TaxID=3402278 RepID=UPI003CF515DA